MPDEIVREVWRTKDRLAKEFNYDIRLAEEPRRREKESGWKVVNLSERRGKQGSYHKGEPLS